MEFIGSYITLKFLAEDYRVKVPVRHSPKTQNIVTLRTLSSNENLEVCKTNLDTQIELHRFAADCNIIVHCGTPFLLGVDSNETPLYIPVINGTHNLLKVIMETPSVEKVIFILSAAIFNAGLPISASGNEIRKLTGKSKIIKTNHHYERARLHSEEVLRNRMNDFTDDRFKVVIVSPIEVKNGTLTNSRESSVTGLQFIFSKKIKQDPVFQKLAKRNILDTIFDVNDLPDRVFEIATQTDMTM